MKKYITGITVLVLTTVLSILIFFRPKPNPVHFHAGFLVYSDGVLQNFSSSKYMKIEPCNTKGVEVHKDEQLEKAHLHDEVGNVAHVHRTGARWSDLFKNIRYAFPKNMPVQGFENGKEIPNFLSSLIKPYESVVIISGNSIGVDLSKSITKDHIIEVEKKVESCGL